VAGAIDAIIDMSWKQLTENETALKALRYAGFIAVTAAIWLGYFAWRPPAPILHIRQVSHLPREGNQVSLTFDDAPHPLTTPLLLAALKRADVKATFFVVGDGMKLYPELTRRIVADGHTLANHSQFHYNLTGITPSEYPGEVDTCFTAIQKAAEGQPWSNTRLFRPPGGGMNRSVMQYIYENDITLAWWSNNFGDWAPMPAWKIVNYANLTMRPGDIFLLHDAGTSTPQAIPSIVKEARARGLEFVPMPEE